VVEASRAQTKTFAERWAAVRRRRWPMLWVAVGVLALTVLGALLWPATYRSSGTILIEQQEMPSDLVQSTITGFADERIQIISQRVMTTDNLLGIIQRYNLYPKLRKNEPREVLLARMRKDINFSMISADVIDPREGRPTKADIAFSVSYDSGSPETAARVANELVSLYLDENLRNRKRISADAEGFLDGEANRLQQSIAGLQASLADFKNKHINTLPDETVINRESLIRAQDEQRDIDTQMRSLAQQSTYLDAQLAQLSPSSQVYTSTGERVLSPSDRLKFLRTQYATLSAIYAPNHPDVLRIKREMEGLEQAAGQVDSSNDLQRQLEDARTQLSQLQKRYAPDYPDVIRLQKQVTALTATISTSATTSKSAPSAVAQPDNPAYIEIKAQRDANGAERDSLLNKRAAVQTRIDDLEHRLAAAPAVERDYNALALQLDNEMLKYRDVRQKQMDAKLSQNLENEQKGEHFTLIEPPLAPEQPVSPNRALLLGLGLVLALGAAIGTVALLESQDRSVRNPRDLESLLQIPPLAVVPRIVTMDEMLSKARHRRFALLGVVGFFALGLLLTNLFYRPLDVLWAVALRKLGG
jgi:uncharacterized protein involved in exopolysaccharide biosynthesis